MSGIGGYEAEVLGRSIVQAAEVFAQKIKEGMIAMAQVTEGTYGTEQPDKCGVCGEDNPNVCASCR